ncbi:MAG: hypothetical protein JRM72_09135 [Nitrososphaerota archaeon]|jgi:hypothetical protein|nr:hypothetical protein [Nitrososphaerota archaeon]MDG7040886.1 hypothetical protein [Nitrososphaerota archaeon]MDG7043177.1 hypothetical protein [Nitrososphaerota archaeon]
MSEDNFTEDEIKEIKRSIKDFKEIRHKKLTTDIDLVDKLNEDDLVLLDAILVNDWIVNLVQSAVEMSDQS